MNVLILSATKNINIEVKPYKDFNSSINCSALVNINGKLMSGRIMFKNNASGEVALSRDGSGFPSFFSDFMVKESNIIGVVSCDLSDYDNLQLTETETE